MAENFKVPQCRLSGQLLRATPNPLPTTDRPDNYPP